MRIIFEIELEGLPPTVNRLYGVSRHRKYKREEFAQWQEQASAKMKEKYNNETSYKDCVEMDVIFSSNSRRRWDVDNRIKALQDCLQFAGVIENDAQIQRLTAERVHGASDKTFVKISEYHARQNV